MGGTKSKEPSSATATETPITASVGSIEPEVVHDGSFERTFDPEEVRRVLHS